MKSSLSTLVPAALIVILGVTISFGAEPARQSILGLGNGVTEFGIWA
jgi:hypothetical protein